MKLIRRFSGTRRLFIRRLSGIRLLLSCSMYRYDSLCVFMKISEDQPFLQQNMPRVQHKSASYIDDNPGPSGRSGRV